MIKKSYYSVLKHVIKIRYIRQIKVWIKHYNINRWYQIFMRDLLSDLNNYAWPAN